MKFSRPGVLGIVRRPDTGDILWIKRADVPIWVLPGGGVDEGEAEAEAVEREVLEETGLHVRVERCCAHYTPGNSFSGPLKVYSCIPVAGEEGISSETTDIGFFPVTSPPSPVFPLHVAWLRECLESRVTIRRRLDEINLWLVICFFMRHPWLMLRYLFSCCRG